MTNTDPRTLKFKVPRPDPEGTRPTTALLFEVDLVPEDQGFSIKFSRSKKYTNLTPAKFAQLCERLGSGDFPSTYNTDPAPDPNYRHTTPLSVRNDEFAYVIYFLSRKNWQFAQYGAPITVENDAEELAYSESKRILPNGDTDYGGIEGEPAINKCRAAYVIVDPAEAMVNGEYLNRVNLHLDCRFKHGQRTLYMPILIDPDIRFPGGTGP